MKYSQILEACWKGYHREGNKKMFGKTYPNCVKNKAKNESTLTEFDPGEGNYGPFQIYIGNYATGKQFATESEALDEIEFLMRADPKSANDEWKIKDALGKTVWSHDPGAAVDDARRQQRQSIQFNKKPPDDAVTEAGRVARKAGQPAHSKKHSDLYTDENPRGTITGLKFATPEDARASVTKIRNSGRSHAHKIQAAVAMEQRARAAGKASAAAVYRRYINANKKTDEQQLAEKCWDGYSQQGTKNKGGRQVPNCVRVSEDHSPDQNTAANLAQDLASIMANVEEIKNAGPGSTNSKYLQELQRNIDMLHKQIRRLGYKYDSQQADLIRPLGRPIAEIKIGTDMPIKEILYKAAAQAIQDAGREGIDLDYETAIKQASKLYGISYQPSELPRLQAQRAEIDRQLALLKQGRQVARQRRAALKAPTPAGTDEYWQTNALPTGRIKPAAKSLEEATDVFLDNAAREMLGLILMSGMAFSLAGYYKIRNMLTKYQGYQIIKALEEKGVTMNRDTYEKVKPVLDQFRQALRDNDGAQVKELATRIQQMIVMGKLSAPESSTQDVAVVAKQQELAEDLKQWFKQKWVRFGPDGKIRGPCARGKSSEGKSKCLPQAKAHALGKKGRAKAGARKRRKDPDANRSGRAINVKTKEDVMTATPISRRPSAIAQGMRRAARVNEFVSGDGSGNEPDFNPETFYDIPKLKKVYKQLASRSVNSGWYDFQLTRLIGAMEDLYTINADVLDEMFPTAPEIANYIERNIIKAFPSETPPYMIKNPNYKPRAPRAAGPAVKESLRAGEYYIAQVTLDTGEVKRVKVTSDEGYDDAIRRHYAAKGRQVVDIDMDFDIQSPVMAEDREQKTNCARTKSAVCQCESVNRIMEDRQTLTAICVLEHGDGVQGTILLKQQPGSPTFIAGEITGLRPGQHGFHIHEFGDLSRGCESAGAHYNPDGVAHGDLQRGHVGDLGNITADQSGRAEFAIVAQRVNLTGDQSVVGRAIVVHSKQDDLGKGGNAESRKSGNAGDRLACGVITLKATVNEAASPAQQAAIAINMKKAGIKPKVKENLRPGESIPAKSIIQGYTVFFDPATRMVSVTRGGVDADAAIEQEQISKATMLAFNSAVYRMITRIEDETEPVLNEGIPFDQCPGCGGPIVHVTMLREKQDACYHKVKSRYKVWPSAYASGALVQCRKKGAANWGNKGK